MEKLQLSDLSHGLDYLMPCAEDADRCRIHVKMTESSMKSVEALIHSDKVRVIAYREHTNTRVVFCISRQWTHNECSRLLAKG